MGRRRVRGPLSATPRHPDARSRKARPARNKGGWLEPLHSQGHRGACSPREEGTWAREDTQPLRHRETARGTLDEEPKGREEAGPSATWGQEAEIPRPTLEACRSMGKGHNPALRAHVQLPGKRSSEARAPAAQHRLLSLARPLGRYSPGMLGSARGAGAPKGGTGPAFRKDLDLPSDSLVEGDHREGNACGPRPQTPATTPPSLTCRWVMFLSMFMGDVTQF